MIVHEPITQTQVGMPMDEFIRLYEQEGPFELIDGERIVKMPTVAGHAEIIKLLNDLLAVLERMGIIVRYTESAFVLADRPDWVKGSRLPDLMVYRAERMAAYKAADPDWRSKPYVLVPDLCIEVISATDIYGDVEEKVLRYLEDGVQAVWVLNPRTHSVSVHMAGSRQSLRLLADDTLDGGAIIPGFAVPVRDLFAV